MLDAGSRTGVLRRSERTRFSSASDDEVAGLHARSAASGASEWRSWSVSSDGPTAYAVRWPWSCAPMSRSVGSLPVRYFGKKAARGSSRCRSVRDHSGRLLVRFAELVDRAGAEAVRGTLLIADVEPDERPAEPGSSTTGSWSACESPRLTALRSGRVASVLHLPAQDLLEIETARRHLGWCRSSRHWCPMSILRLAASPSSTSPVCSMTGTTSMKTGPDADRRRLDLPRVPSAAAAFAGREGNRERHRGPSGS